jgi:hypothetical protein
MKNYSKFTFYVTGDKLCEVLTAIYLRIQAQKSLKENLRSRDLKQTREFRNVHNEIYMVFKT